MGFSYCRFHCGKKWRFRGTITSTELLGTDELTDGEWLWPKGLPHYIEAHDVCLPEEVVARMELHGWRAPADSGIRNPRGQVTSKLKLIGYWAPSLRVEPPGESPLPDVTLFVRPHWRPTDRGRIAEY